MLFVLLFSRREASHSCETLRELLHDPRISNIQYSAKAPDKTGKRPVLLIIMYKV